MGREQGHLPQDAFYAAQTFLDTSGFCCSLTNHLTVDQTTVNLDYLPANWTMNDFQVIKWPYAACPVFEFPKMDLTVHEIEYSGKKEYPFEHAGLKITMCAYRQPPPTEASDEATFAPTEETLVTEKVVVTEEVLATEPEEEQEHEFIELAEDDGTVTRIEDKVDENVSGSEPGAVDDNEVAYQESLMPQLEALHEKYQGHKSNDKYAVNPFDTSSPHTKLFRNRRAGCYFSTTEAFCTGDSSPFVEGLQICCDHEPENSLVLDKLWEKPYPDDFFTIRRDDNERCRAVTSDGDETIIRQEVVFKYDLEILKLNACIYTIISDTAEEDTEGDKEAKINLPEAVELVTTAAVPEVESRPLMGYIKTSGNRCMSETSSTFVIVQDTEDHPTNIANCSDTWVENVVPYVAGRGKQCSSESHGLVTWELCMGEFPEFNDDIEGKLRAKTLPANDSSTQGYCFFKAAIVTCTEGYTERSIKFRNEVNGNQNNYEFKRVNGKIYEKIWPGGYFGPGPELQIDMCCAHVTAENEIASDVTTVAAVVESNTNDMLLAADSNEVVRIAEDVDPLVYEQRAAHRFALVRFGDQCPLLGAQPATEGWFDFPTEKNNDYDSTGGVAEKSEVGIKLNICLY